jgi:tetratricopeptide (TPR) repeat protein
MAPSLRAVQETLSALRDLPYGPVQIAAIVRQLAQLETEGPEEALPEAYRSLVTAHFFGGQGDKAFVPYAKFVALYEKRPELFDSSTVRSLMWENKWIVSQLREFAAVPATQVETALEDMARRYGAYGVGADALAMCRFAWARHRGAPDADDLYAAWQRCEQDHLSDCETCVAASQADYLFDRGRLDEGIAVVERVLEDGATCEEEPGTILARLQLAYLDRGALGDEQRAIWTHRRSLDFIAKRELLTDAHAHTIEFLARVRQGDAALRHVHRAARYFRACESDLTHLTFLVYAGAGLRILAEDLGMGDQALVLPDLPEANTVAGLWQWCQSQAVSLAAAFDSRNGTDRFTAQAEAAWRVQPQDHLVDLVPVALRTILGVDPSPAAEADPAASDARPAAPSSPDPAASIPPTPADHLSDAERRFADDPAGAAIAYLLAARGFEALGELAAAAYAHAEAAHLAGTLDEFTEAEEEYARAAALFKAATIDPVQTTPVVIARAALLTDVGHWQGALRVLDALAEQLIEAETALARADVSDDLRERRNHDLTIQEATIQRARAQALAAGGDLGQGVAVAERAAEAFAEADDYEQAAAAFRVAGTTALRLGDTDRALYGLESAFEGYGLTYRRQEQAEVADLLLPLYRGAGRSADIERLLALLSRR